VGTVWAFNIAAGVLCGMGAALVWTGQGVYLSRAATHAAAAAARDGDTGDQGDEEDASLLVVAATAAAADLDYNTSASPKSSDGSDGAGSMANVAPTATTFTVASGGDRDRGEYDSLVVQQHHQQQQHHHHHHHHHHHRPLTARTLARRVGVYNKRFNSIFFSLLQFSGATGTLTAFLVLEFVPGVAHALYSLFLVLGGCAVCGILVIACCLPDLEACTAAGGNDNNDSSNNYDADDHDDDGTAADLSPDAVDALSASSPDPPGLLDTLKLCRDPRLRYLIPIIFYNGASLGFLWQSFNALAWNKAVGLSFVGLGSAFWFLVNTVFSPLLGRVAERVGYLKVMLAAALSQALFFTLLLVFPIAPLACLSTGCADGTAGPCWKLPPSDNASAADPLFPAGCGAPASLSSSLECAVCSPYDAAGGNKCSAEWFQCEWLGSPGDAAAPAAPTMVLLFVASALHAIGDSVWETQLPAVLQTIFTDDRDKAAAMANLKMWQSLGVSVLFAMSFGCSLVLQSAAQLALLTVSAGLIYVAHHRVVDLDSGRKR
jgi:hypothetical protein